MAYTSPNEYLSELEKLLKKNRGTRVNTLYDTDANTPDQLVTARPQTQKRDDYALEPDSIGQLEFQVPQLTQRGQVAGATTGMSTQDFLRSLGEVYFSPEVQGSIQQSQGQQNQVMDSDGGYLGVDNKFYYDDGTVRESQDTEAVPMGSAPNGSGILYSDGSIRRERTAEEYKSVPPVDEYAMASVSPNSFRMNTGKVREGSFSSSKPISNFNEYLSLLSGGKLGEGDVTGAYGEYYGMPREAYNIGTDIGTGKFGSDQIDIALPFGAEVVSVGRWDGRNANSTTTPYGNSVLVKLPTGHMMRFSHLSNLGNIKEGDTIDAGTYIGTTGDTGHAFGKHLDHELYDPEGQLTSSEGFFNSIASSPEIAQKLSTSGLQLGNYVSEAPKSSSQVASQPYTPPTENPIVKTVDNVANNIFKPVAEGATKASNLIEQTKPTGDYGVGLSEYMKGDIAGGKKELGKTIEKLNPTGEFDLGISESLAGNPALAQEKQKKTAETLGQNVSMLGKSFGLPEMGISEFISNIPNSIAKPVYAGEIGKPEPAQENIFSQALSQAGSGVSALKNVLGTIDENIFKKKDLSKIGQKNVIGEDTGGTIGANLGDIKSTPADNRDAFIKGGGTETYKDYLQPGINSKYRGSLSTNLFKDSFYENPDNVANVFGNTYLGKDATGKYKSYMGTQYPIKPGGESPTIKKSEQYLGSYDGLTVDGEYWKDAFSRQGKDVNSSEGKSFQDRERQNQKTWEYEDVNPIYYENQYNKSVLDSIPEVLKSAFSFIAPRTGKTAQAGMSSPQGLYQPVKGDETAKTDYSKARSIPQLPAANVFKPQGQMQSVPSVLGASINKPSIPRPTPAPTPSYSAPSKPSTPSYSAPSKPNASYQSKPVYNAPSAPAPAPRSTPAPNASYQSKPVYNPPPQMASKPSYSAPKPAPVSTPAPKPASKPASNQSNVFQNLVNYLFGWR